MSWITAPEGDVTIAMRCGRNGSGRRRLGWSSLLSPSASSFAFNALNAAILSPCPAMRRRFTLKEYCPRDMLRSISPCACTLRPSTDDSP